MFRKSFHFVATLVFCLAALGAASAQCAAPASPGINICFPNEGSTQIYVPAMEMSATVASGAIRTVKIWDNGTLRDTENFLPGTLFDGSMYNGLNKVTVQVWDTAGNFYQAKRSFYVTGYGVGFCSAPTTAGVNLCWPLQGSLQPQNFPISAAAKGSGSSKITSLAVYVDGKKAITTNNNYILTGNYQDAGSHKVTVIAHDAAGHAYQASHTFTSFYEQDCNPKNGACSAGIVINKPASSPDVPTSFTFQADVQYNTEPITAMKVYLDNKVVATSSGPGITAEIKLPANTTHVLWVKAWDSKGKQYAAYQNYFVH